MFHQLHSTTHMHPVTVNGFQAFYNIMERNVEEEAHCYVIRCRQIVCGQYVAD